MAAPLVYYRGAVNAASYMPQALPGGGIAQGSIFSIFGSGIGPGTPVKAESFPLQTTLGNVSVTVAAGGTTVNAIPVYVSNNQISAIMPSNAPLGTASLRVAYNGTSNPIPIQIVTSAFGIFAVNSAGMGPGVLQNFISAESEPVNSPGASAHPRQVMVLWGTGLGPALGPDNLAPAPANLPTPVEVFVGGISAKILYSGRAPCCSGTDQIDFQVPDDAPLGCWTPVYVRTGGSTVSNTVTMAIQNGSDTCSDPANPFSSVIVAGGTAGGFVAVHTTTHEDVGTVAPVDVNTDFQASAFFSGTAAPFPFNSGASLPPPGTCTIYTVKGDLLEGDLLPALTPPGRALDAGAPIKLTSANGPGAAIPVAVPPSLPQFLLGYFGGAIGGTTISGVLPLAPGSYTLTGAGGADIGAFQANLTVPSAITWTNRDQLINVDRTQPLTISWTGGGGSDRAGIVGFGEDLPGNASAEFICIAPPGASSFTIPPPILENLPATRPNPLQSKGVIYLVSVPGSALVPLQAKGLDAGLAMFTYIDGKTVVFR
ncbi:MAG TPA: hypothetical protein VFW83_03550 [Bryobacteraceae bacterium]|nr:hypothetical protein [Bryobacteraceae bacterium]